ncbi:cation:proton antiporter [Candidatus Phycosocius spiralis]|uniref:Sodium/hydrogen exchanger family protein n=1 Tax=Candidatus Phycosocius spiralis TaxID=2815099 RepID=A0ABQ4PT93_9PROT|nr:cation:proton antiporter [Candidatus Phycosocius spiralis]GIU66196.1 sodium/hydrogen exchanger family protein [Candidatus Phycosocius spiralis]
MTIPTTELFLIAMVIIFTIPYLFWRVLKTDYYAPLAVVQIIGGIVLGPGILGAVFPAYYDFIFTPAVIQSLNGIAWWAVMIFVWIAGIELDLKSAWTNRLETGVTAGLAMIMPLVFGCGAGIVLLNFSGGWIGPKGHDWQFIVGIGMACAVTALPILVLFLEKLEILRQPLGQRILRFASLDDIAIWGVLAIILLDWGRVGRQAMFLLAFFISAVAILKLMRAVKESDRWYLGLIWLAVVGFAADWSGLHYMVGAFLAGVVLDADLFDRTKLDRFRDHVLLAIMPVFFLSTGLRTNWDVGGLVVFGAAAILLVAAVSGKLVGVHLAGRILNWPKGEAHVIGWLLQTKALIMIIFVNVLLDKGIISNQTFTAALLMAVASTMLSIPMVTPQLAKLRNVVDKPSAEG